MPLYEYECDNGHKHELLRPMSQSKDDSVCAVCGHLAKRIMSPVHFRMGFKFLKGKKSKPAPTDSGYHPEWDQAYAPTRGGDEIKV